MLKSNHKYAITSKVGGILFSISLSPISTRFGLNDLAGKTSFEKQELHADSLKDGMKVN
ncbi:hypothetical protein Hanom_Chr11g01013531 [Helianthus anomalus]